ncbi:MAG: TRAP transporter small permease subunit, partial [Pseudomonadota bacterium]
DDPADDSAAGRRAQTDGEGPMTTADVNMTPTETTMTPPRAGTPAPVTRLFGWGMLMMLAAFMINNVLNVSFGLPGARAVLAGGEGSGLAWIQALLYVVALGLTAAIVFGRPESGLRWESKRISDFNAYIIRACFWSVLMVGIADAAIAFMRVENFLPIFFGEDMAKDFGRARFVGPYVHIPLIIVGFLLALVTRTLGFTWLALMIVAAELLIVISRFVFSYEQALMGDLVRYWYAALFLFASAYTLLEDGHVRVDVLYASFDSPRKGFVNAIGSILLGMTTAWVIIWIGFNGKTAIINSPVANFEVTQTGGTGMFIKYQMAMFLGIFAITMLIQFVSYLFEAVADMRGEPGKREIAPIAH